MFLPDGKALIMDQELYRNTISNSIVIDLVENKQIMNDGHDSDSYQMEEHKVSRNKDITRKPSQANQKKQNKNQTGDNQNIISNMDAGNNDNYNMGLHDSMVEESGHHGNQSSGSGSSDQFKADTAQKDFLNLINQQEFSDVALIVEGKKIYAHQVILASRSTFFETLFSNNFQETEEQVVNFNDSGLTYAQLMNLLRHIYSDNIKVEGKHIYDILSVSTFLSHLYNYFIALVG